MLYDIHITVTLRPSILDPQGKASHHALSQLGFTGIEQVRIGKFIELKIEAESVEAAEEQAASACRKLLANEVMEDFTVTTRPTAQPTTEPA